MKKLMTGFLILVLMLCMVLPAEEAVAGSAGQTVTLRYSSGKEWRKITIPEQNQTVFFPDVSLNETGGTNCIGWSVSGGKSTDPEYDSSDLIPNECSVYYMVEFPEESDLIPDTETFPLPDCDALYFVGDSRMVYLEGFLDQFREWEMTQYQKDHPSAPDHESVIRKKVSFICEYGQGLDWFEETGYETLKKKLEAQEKKKENSLQAVIVNLGVNDDPSKKGGEYVSFLKDMVTELKKSYNCRFYYMSVNPVNSATLKTHDNGKDADSKACNILVKKMNEILKTGLADTGYFQWIDTYHELYLKEGWRCIGDGIHYSRNTALRTYVKCVEEINKDLAENSKN